MFSQPRCLSGKMDPLTYKKMILPIKDKLYRLAKMMLQTREEAEDALQDVLLKLWDNRQNLANYRSVEALAMRMTKNQCLNRLKSLQYRRGPDAHAVEVGSSELPPDRSLEVHDSLRLMQRLVESLPPQQQLVMHLRNVEGYSYEEIEEITGMTVNAIRVNLSRARQQLKEQFSRIDNYENQ